MALGESLASTPSWAVASVTALLVILSLLMEHSFHLISHFADKRKRKSLNQAVYQLKSGLRSLGFITLLLTMANQHVSKICISRSFSNTFLPCVDQRPSDSLTDLEEESACGEGKVPLLSPEGTQQLQMLILILAVSHVICSLLTLVFGELKMKRWEQWEQETATLDHKLSIDNRRFKVTKETSFGQRHLKFWSNNFALLWTACLLRQFTGSVSKADYFALRRGFIDAHLGTKTVYNFHKFLRRSLDKDFKTLVTISVPIWAYVVLFIICNAHGFYSYLWRPFIPFVLLLVVGTKLEVIITEMCLKGSQRMAIISGEVTVIPTDELFWFRQPRLLLYVIQFILIENSFQIAFLLWDMYTFGYKSCWNRSTLDFIIFSGTSLLIEFICAYVTLPLYALVTQMGSSMKETIFADQIISGLRRWQAMAKRNLGADHESVVSIPASPASIRQTPTSSTPMRRRSPSPRATWNASRNHHSPSLMSSPPSAPRVSLPSQSAGRGRGTKTAASSFSHSLLSRGTFEFPTSRRELEEIQKVTEEMMGASIMSRTSGEVSLPSQSAGRGRATKAAASSFSHALMSPSPFEFPTSRRELEEIQKVTEEMMGASIMNRSSGEASFRMWWKQEMVSPRSSPSNSIHRG